MKRNLAELQDRRFDVLIIGAGIYGACIAREAALRGLSAALVDRGDFGAATSANSLKIVHGGLRYLQSLNVRRMRESVRERRALIRIAPHLIRRLPCVVPTHGRGGHSAAAMRAALKLSAWIAPDPGGHWPSGEILSRGEVCELFPGLSDDRRITGGALWYDGLALNTERLTLAFVRSAVERGAVAANYAEVTGLLLRNHRVEGATVRDGIDGGEAAAQARITINAAGPWAGRVAGTAGIALAGRRALLSRAWNIVTKPLHPTHALGVQMRRGNARDTREGRFLFIVPWRGHSIVGTLYAPAERDDRTEVTDQDVEELVEAVNRAYPAANLQPGEVRFRHGGLLPVARRDHARGVDKLAGRCEIIDHQREHGLAGLFSVIGVKYTTARAAAERVIEAAAARLGRQTPPVDSAGIAVDGGDLADLGAFEAGLRAETSGVLQPHIGRLVRNYGRRATEVIACHRALGAQADALPDGTEMLAAEIRYAVRQEMAVRLADVIRRRTDPGTAGYPGRRVIRQSAEIMGEELGWSTDRIDEEIAMVGRLYESTASQTGTAE